MKKYIYSSLALATSLLTLASCDDYLETTSPSVVDADFVFSNTTTARAAMEGAYESWRSAANSYVFGAGLFYAADIAGSDIERHPEGYASQPARHVPEGLYENGVLATTYNTTSYNSNDNTGCYVKLYGVIGQANAVISAMQKSVVSIIEKGEQDPIGQLYGEAIALRATCYRELLRFYGDVPYATVFGEPTGGLVSRDSIYDAVLADLVKVEPLMYPVGSIPGVPNANKNYFSQTYVQGLIGRIALEAGGYMTRRADLTYVNGKGEAVQFEKLGQPNANAANAFYARRSDWKEKYELAKTYLAKALANSGTASLVTVDPRKADKGKVFGNPYQYFYQEMMNDDAIYATESIYEYPMEWNVTSDERSYSNGRANTGGGTGYPTKVYGQCRINPAFYYGIYDPKDMRRDVTWSVTGVNDGVEVLIPLSMGSQAKAGGITMNKWDINRMVNPNTKAQRKDGINGPYMHIGELYLSYAEACAGTNAPEDAKKSLLKIRSRAFENYTEADLDAFIAKCGELYPESTTGWSPLYKAIVEERGFEYAGEGDRRMTLIRTGLLPDAIKRIKDLTEKMFKGLEDNGCFVFDNGNVICDSIYTKNVDAKTLKGHRLTTQHLVNDDEVLYPGWRGTHDDWASFGWAKNIAETNLAIKGLFSQEDGAALKADGYTAVAWGKQLASLKDEYYTHLFTNYDYKSAPIYLWPICPNAVAAGGFVNGYGFKNE